MQNVTDLNKKERVLVERAKKHAKNSYKEGITSMAAALSTKEGKTILGINVKYKSVWKCICAEKVAIAKAIEENVVDLDTIVTVKYSPKTNEFSVMNMCGECRQLAIFYPHLRVISEKDNKVISVAMKDMFPYPYV